SSTPSYLQTPDMRRNVYGGYGAPDFAAAADAHKKSTRKAVKLYWLIFLILSLAAFPLYFIDQTALWVIVLGLLPGIQFAVGIITILMVMILPFTDRSAAVAAVAKIMLGVFVGAAVAIGIMIIGAFVFLK